jgi:hypothetical protein
MTGHGPVRRATLAVLLAAAVLQTTPAAADPSARAWALLRNCESGGNYTIVSVNHRYYGAYQFDLVTWRSVRGVGYPNHASPLEQDYRALYLYRMRGWKPWGCARALHLRLDSDGGSKRIPTYADATRMTDPGDPWLLQ